jgi:hypothetical protein
LSKTTKVFYKANATQPMKCGWLNSLPTAMMPLYFSITAPTPQQAIAYNAIEHKTKANDMTFLHAACSSPATFTFLQAVKA